MNVHGRPPYGYRLAEVDGKRTLVIHEPEARIVRLVFTWYVEGDGESGPLPIYQIVQRLSGMGIPTRADGDDGMAKQRGYGQWNRAAIHKMLKRETYQGRWHYGKYREQRTNGRSRRVENARDHWIAVEVPAIISRDLWEAAQVRLERNRQDARRNTKHQYLLRRRVVCGHCGARIGASTTSAAKGGYQYYYCPAHVCDDYAVRCQPEQAEREEANKPLRDRLAVVGDLLADTRCQLERLIDLYVSGDFPREALTERKERLEGTVEALERERQDLVPRLEAQTLTDEQVQTITEFAREVVQGLEIADASFEARRYLIEALDVWATLVVEDRQKVIYVRCMVGDGVLPVASTSTGRRCASASCRRSLGTACHSIPGASATVRASACPGSGRLCW